MAGGRAGRSCRALVLGARAGQSRTADDEEHKGWLRERPAVLVKTEARGDDLAD